jgi:hypothetical protein
MRPLFSIVDPPDPYGEIGLSLCVCHFALVGSILISYGPHVLSGVELPWWAFQFAYFWLTWPLA